MPDTVSQPDLEQASISVPETWTPHADWLPEPRLSRESLAGSPIDRHHAAAHTDSSLKQLSYEHSVDTQISIRNRLSDSDR